MPRQPFFFCVPVLLLLALPACAALTYTAEPIEAWAIDAETKKPLEGVVVTANWQLLGGMEGSLPLAQMQVMETQTGPDGVFRFPAWGPLDRPQGYLREDDPQLLLFKPGYEYKRLANAVSSKINYESVRRSQWNGKTIEMRPFKGTMEEYAGHVYELGRDMDRILDFARGDRECNWKKVPRMLVALDRMGLRFESQGVKLKAWRLGQHVLRIEDIPADSQCGSPMEYLRSYLP